MVYQAKQILNDNSRTLLRHLILVIIIGARLKKKPIHLLQSSKFILYIKLCKKYGKTNYIYIYIYSAINKFPDLFCTGI